MAHRGVLWRTGDGAQTPWAGQLIHNAAADGVVVGPLVPKASSTTLRAMHGNADRPPGLTGRGTPKPPASFQLAAVRHPLEHFIAGYKQNGLWFDKAKRDWGMRLPLYPPRDANVTIAQLYCDASDEERAENFADHVNMFTSRPMEKRDPHHVPQLHWLQNYVVASNGSRVEVISAVDALLRLERFGHDWVDATAEARRASKAKRVSPRAAEWMMTKRNAKVHDRDHASMDDDRLKKWEPLCGEDGGRRYFRTELRYHEQDGKVVAHDVDPSGRAWRGYTGVALGQLHHHYAWRYLSKHLKVCLGLELVLRA